MILFQKLIIGARDLLKNHLHPRGKVLSLDVPKEKLSSIGAGLVFPDATARHFWQNLKIHYSVCVSSKKSIKKKNESSSSASSSNSKNGDKANNAKKDKTAAAQNSNTTTSSSEVSKIHVSASAHSLSSTPATTNTGGTSGTPVRVEADSSTVS